MSDVRRKRHPGALRTRNENGEVSHRPQHGPGGPQSHNSRGRNNNAQTGSYRDGQPRMNSSDKVKRIVQQEGRMARNLVIYNVPVQSSTAPTDRSRSRQVKKPIPKEHVPVKYHVTEIRAQKTDVTKSPKSDGGKKPDLRARYWKFLFDNLQRAVDAIYETCEQDESALECKEVIMMLEQSTRDFKSLIERLQVQKEFELAFKDGDRPTSIAWAVRKMSPGKSPSGMAHHGHTSPSPAQRVLNFSHPGDQKASQRSGNSWADRVKGTTAGRPGTKSDSARENTPQKELPAVLPSPPILSPVPSSMTSGDSYRDVTYDSDESDGWETVKKGGRVKPRASPAQRSLENLNTVSVIEHKLKRSVSDPNACVPKSKRQNDSVKSTADGTLMSEMSHGTSTEDSEKENRPKKHTKSPVRASYRSNLNGHVRGEESQTQCRPTTVEAPSPSPETVVKPNIPRKGAEKTVIKSRIDSGLNKLTPKVEEKSQSKTKMQGTSTPKTNAWSKPTKPPSVIKDKVITVAKIAEVKTEVQNSEEKLEPSDVQPTESPAVEDKSASDDLDEMQTSTDLEQEVEELDDALASALEEEDSLTNELEEQDHALEVATMEEETWLKELAREENTVIEEVEIETESELRTTTSSLEVSQASPLDWDDMVAQYDEAEAAGTNKSWGEMVEEAETRTPGHAVHMHEKLSSPSRKRSLTDTRKRHEEKQAKAQEQRDRLMQEKSERLRDIGKKVDEVRAWKEEIMRQKKATIESKMAQAEEKRLAQLKSKAHKAHDEEAKANEIAFINTLEAQNKRLDIMSKHQESEARLQDIQDERQRRHEEKLAKEAAVEERRHTLQAERLARMLEIQQRRKIKDARIEQHLHDKEHERLETVRAKEKDREERLAALNAQHILHIQELQKKIQQKQDESSQRHEEAIKQIRVKAFEMSVLRHSTEDHNDAPEITPYDRRKMCTICNALIPSEVYLLSHLRGKTHQQALKHNNGGKAMTKLEIETFNLKHIVNAPDNSTHPKIVSEKERLKSLKKRCKKLKQRMNSRGLEYDNSLSGKQTTADSENKAKLQKVIRDTNKYLQSQESGPWSQSRVSALDRALGEIKRVFDKRTGADQTSFRVLGGFTTLSRIVQLVDTANIHAQPVIPQKTMVLVSMVLKQACKGYYDNCHYMMFSNKINLVIELLIHQLTILLPTDPNRPGSGGPLAQEKPKLPYNLLAINLLQLLSTVLTCIAKNSPSTKSSEASLERMGNTVDGFTSRGNDIISYIISVGIVDKLNQYLRMVQGPIDSDREAAEFIQHSLALLVAITKFMSKRKTSIFEKRKMEDPTQLISTFEVTELVGIVSLLYGMLLHSGTPSRGDATPPEFPQHTLAVATTGLRMLNHMATLDLDMLQGTMGQEGMSLEFRHIASYLIWYCSQHNAEELLHEVVLCVGYFTVHNLDNQLVIQSGQPPTVLQQLCALPFQYFSDPRLVNILFPSLISCCYSNQANREILEQELSCILLSNFIEEKQLELQQQNLSTPTNKKDKEKRENKDGDANRMTLAARFPIEQWTATQEYFKVAC